MTAAVPASNSLESLVRALGSADGVARHDARVRLVTIGEPAVPALIGALKARDGNTRWEAAKALTQVRDASAAQALADALTDEVAGVRWLAAEALSLIGRAALEPVLHGLINRSGSAWYREGAHHVLKAFADTDLAPAIAPVLQALEHVEPAIGVLVPTERLLQALQVRS